MVLTFQFAEKGLSYKRNELELLLWNIWTHNRLGLS